MPDAPDIAVLERMLKLARQFDVRGLRGAGWEFELNPAPVAMREQLETMTDEERAEQFRRDKFAAGVEVPDLRAIRGGNDG